MPAIDAHITDARGVYLRTETLSIYAAQPAGAVYAELPEAEEGFTRVAANAAWRLVADADVPAEPFTDSSTAAIPAEIPRWAGVLSLKRHQFQAGVLVLLDSNDAGDASLFASVMNYRDAQAPGEARDRLDVALLHAKDWLRMSPTVAGMVEVLGLSGEQADSLFIWAGAQVGSV